MFIDKLLGLETKEEKRLRLIKNDVIGELNRDKIFPSRYLDDFRNDEDIIKDDQIVELTLNVYHSLHDMGFNPSIDNIINHVIKVINL